MVWTRDQKYSLIIRKLQDITRDVEILDKGICDLEVRLMRIQQGSHLTERNRSECNYLNAMNTNTANMVKRGIKESESLILHELNSSPKEAKNLVNEFVTVLRSAYRVLQTHHFVQEECVRGMNSRKIIIEEDNVGEGDEEVSAGTSRRKKKCPVVVSDMKEAGGNKRQLNSFGLFLRKIFICGGSCGVEQISLV